MKTSYTFYKIIGISGLVLLLTAMCGFAWEPPIDVTVSLDKTSFAYGEPVGNFTITVNNYGPDFLISRGFHKIVYVNNMRVLDPANRLLLLTNEQFHNEFPDAPPIGYIRIADTDQVVRAAGCEMLPAGWTTSPPQSVSDLKTIYNLELPGFYSVQVQLWATVWLPDTGSSDPSTIYCNKDDFAWRGTLKSNTVYFSIIGDTELIKIAPANWKTKWLENDKKAGHVQVHFKPEKGKKTADYIPASVTLNGETAKRIKVLKPMIKAYYDRGDVLERLGDVQVGQTYTVTMCIDRKDSQTTYCGQDEITISN